MSAGLASANGVATAGMMLSTAWSSLSSSRTTSSSPAIGAQASPDASVLLATAGAARGAGLPAGGGEDRREGEGEDELGALAHQISAFCVPRPHVPGHACLAGNPAVHN